MDLYSLKANNQFTIFCAWRVLATCRDPRAQADSPIAKGPMLNLPLCWPCELGIKTAAIEWAGALKRSQKEQKTIMLSILQTLITEESKALGEFKLDIRDLKIKLEARDQERYHGALIRARADKLARDELPTKRALCIEKSYAHKNTITEIEVDGNILSDRRSIESAFYSYYSELFSYNLVDVKTFRAEFLPLLPRLSEENSRG